MIHKVVLYGSGRRCRILCRILHQTDIEIVSIVDSNPDKWGSCVEGHKVECPAKIRELQDISLCITVADSEAKKKIRKSLKQIYKYDLEKEVHYNKLILEAYKQCLVIEQYVKENAINSDQKESVLFDCYNGLVLGGVEAWTMDLCSALIGSGKNEVYIISDNGIYDVPDALKKHVIYVDINHAEQFSLESIKNLIKAIAQKLPCRVITCTTNEVMLAAYLIKLYCPNQIQIISVIHNCNERVYEEYMNFRECPDLYIGVSQDIIEDMIQQGIEKDKLYSMTCPFSCESVLSRSYSEDILMPIRIGYAGRMEYSQKRMDLLMKLIEVLMKEKIHFEMEIAGDGRARKDMEKFVVDHHLDKRVHFLGRIKRSEIPLFWENKDICVNLADFEGRSITIIEAMGNGVVPVVTETSGVKEDIVDGVNGYIIPLEDYVAAANRIKYLDKHRERLHEMGRLAHDAVYPKSLMKHHLIFWKEIFLKGNMNGESKEVFDCG